MKDKKEELEDIIADYITAGKILSQVRSEAEDKIKIGASLLEVANHVEQRTIELGGFPAFPCNLSRNDEAAHATPRAGEETVFGKDVVKLDMGVHVNGYIADSAITVDLSNENSDLVKATADALEAAIEIVKSKTTTAQIGNVIEETIKGHGFKPVINLTGHGVAQYMAHTPPSIPNRHIDHGVELKAGDSIAIEPFATDGAGRIADGNWAEIYQLVDNRPIRLPAARKVMKELKQYRTLPFAKRWLTSDKLDYSLMQLEKVGNVMSYPVLKEVEGGMVSQKEHTMLVTEDGCLVTTR